MEGDIYSGCLLGFIFGGHLFFVGGGGELIYGSVYAEFYGIRVKG